MFDLSSQQFLHLLPYWGYPLMFILMILEGPFATMIAAFLASLGYFNIFFIFILGVSGDLVGDLGLYYIGYSGGRKILEKAEKFLRISDSTLKTIENKFHQNSSRIIFYVKSTTGLCAITFILAGTLRMKLSKFIKYSFLGGLVWTSILVLLGYFFGYAAEQISQYIKYAGVAIFATAILAMVIIIFYKKYESKKILENNKKT